MSTGSYLNAALSAEILRISTGVGITIEQLKVSHSGERQFLKLTVTLKEWLLQESMYKSYRKKKNK